MNQISVYEALKGRTHLFNTPEEVSARYRIPLGKVLQSLRDGTSYKTLRMSWQEGQGEVVNWKHSEEYRKAPCCRTCGNCSTYTQGRIRCVLAERETGLPFYTLPSRLCNRYIPKG